MLFSSSAFPHSVVETYNTFFHVRRNTGDIILLRQVHVITSFRQHASRKHQELNLKFTLVDTPFSPLASRKAHNAQFIFGLLLYVINQSDQ